MRWMRLMYISLFAICLGPVHVYSQDYRVPQHISNAAVFPDSSVLFGSAILDVSAKIDTNFRVLGIGEQTHGTSEFFTARIALIKSLAKSGKITKIALEAPFAEVENLNKYITQGEGDLRLILKSFRLYNYECQEFVELVERVKNLNRSGKVQLKFFGVDMQSPFQALNNLSEFCVSNRKALADTIKKLTGYYRLLDNEIYNHAFTHKDYADLLKLSNQIVDELSRDTSAFVKKSIVYKSTENYRQFLVLNSPENSYQIQSTLRDSLMAVNIVVELAPEDKIIFLAHNGHVQRTSNLYSKSTGSFLAKRLGKQYQCIGLTTSSGFYTAFTPKAGKITDKNRIPAAEAGTYEYEFLRVKKPVLFFNTSIVKKQNGNAPLPNRYKLLPFGLTEKPFIDSNILDDFNYLLHIQNTTGNKSFYLN